MKKYLVILVVVVLVSVSLWKFVDATGAGANLFKGCAKSTDGSVYLIGNGYPNLTCLGTDKAISWSKRNDLHLYDANNQDLGIILGADPLALGFTTYISSVSMFMSFKQNFNPILPQYSGIYFSNLNCLGTAYTDQLGANQGGILDVNGNFYKYTADPALNNYYPVSMIVPNGTCVNQSASASLFYPVIKVANPFNQPILKPFHIQ